MTEQELQKQIYIFRIAYNVLSLVQHYDSTGEDKKPILALFLESFKLMNQSGIKYEKDSHEEFNAIALAPDLTLQKLLGELHEARVDFAELLNSVDLNALFDDTDIIFENAPEK